MNQNSFKKIVLAIDPLEDELKLKSNALKELRHFLHQVAAPIEAIYVLEAPRDDVKINQRYQLARDALVNSVKELELKMPVTPTVLIDKTTSFRHQVQTLIHYAVKEKADLILLSSHGRHGLGKIILGSFAELLIQNSPIPVLLLGTQAKETATSRTVLFPTDFSKESERAFTSLLPDLKALHSKLVIFHSFTPRSFFYDYALMGFGAYIPENYWNEQKQIATKNGQKWLKIATGLGISTQLVFDNKSVETHQAIQRAAKESKATFIALACNKTGGVTSDLIRSQKYALWIYGPTLLEKRTRAKPVSQPLPRVSHAKSRQGKQARL